MKTKLIPFFLVSLLFVSSPFRTSFTQTKDKTGSITKIYVTDITGDISAKMGDILASGIRTTLLKHLNIEVFTYKNLADQLKVEQQKEILRCEKETKCIDEVVSGFGISAKMFGDVKKMKEGSYFIDLSLTDRGKMLNSVSRQVQCKDEDCLIGAIRPLALELFGIKKPEDAGTFQEREIGEKPSVSVPETETGMVIAEFASEPAGAMVEIEGKPVCETPCSKKIPSGSVTISMKKVKYLPKEDSVNVRKGMEPVSWKLEPNFGWLTVKSEPSGLSVYINGKLEGKTPISGKEVDPGIYEVIVRDEKYYDSGKEIKINRGEKKVVDVKMEPRKGTLKVDAVDDKGNDLTGEVFVDGAKAGELPYQGKMIIGKHEIEAKTKKGSFRKTAVLKENEVLEIKETVKGRGETGEMVFIPAGSFMMGCSPSDSECEEDEKPDHKVYLDGSYIDKYEVTAGEFQNCVDAGKCSSNNYSTGGNCTYGVSGKENHPINCVTWYGAQEYCEWAGKRLPTEAEWEKAARGGTDTKYPWGNGFETGKANCDEGYCKDGYQTTSPVGSFMANGHGLFDMIGNVWEWVSDWYDEKYYQGSAGKNPSGPSSGHYKVLRGGSWDNGSWNMRVSGRAWYYPGGRLGDFGFRCAED